MHDDIRLAKNHYQASKMEILNLYHEQIPKAVKKTKRIPTWKQRVLEVWENFAQSRLGSKFWGCDLIKNKIYWVRPGSNLLIWSLAY